MFAEWDQSHQEEDHGHPLAQLSEISPPTISGQMFKVTVTAVADIGRVN